MESSIDVVAFPIAIAILDLSLLAPIIIGSLLFFRAWRPNRWLSLLVVALSWDSFVVIGAYRLDVPVGEFGLDPTFATYWMTAAAMAIRSNMKNDPDRAPR